MRRLRASMIATTTLAASLAMYAAPAVAANPVCTGPVPRELCGGRVFAEPMMSTSAVTYAQMVDGLQALADEFPEWVTFDTFGDGSSDGRGLLVVEVTSPDSSVPVEDRKVVLVNQSIHGNEPGGREGAPRYIEDLLRDGDPARTALLDRVRLVQTFINPDGWAAGDHDDAADDGDGVPGLWIRGNGSSFGVSDVSLDGNSDLNRQAPWRGLIPEGREPASQPESAAFAAFVRELAATSDIQASVDIHGEVPDAAAVIMLSSGQFDLDDALNQRVQGDAVAEATFSALTDSQANQFAQMFGEFPAAILHASSEFGAVNSGGSGSGFQGDWIAQPEGGDSASLSTIELYNFAGSPGVNSLTARKEVMQLYRDTVRGVLGGLIDQAALEHDTTLVTEGTVAWLDDHARVPDPVREGVVVSAADFFTDLAPQLSGDLVRVTAADLVPGALDDVDSLVVSTANLRGDADALAVVRAFVEGGGNLLLTDTGLQLSAALVDGIADDDVVQRTSDIGLNVYDREHALSEGIREIAYMNVEAATMGYQVTGSGNVPVWGVASDRWEAAGGTTAATSTVDGGTTSVGEVVVGDGTVRAIGLLLPPPRNEGRILEGINSYGLLDTGFIVLANALDAELVTGSGPSVEGVAPVGDVTIADVRTAPAPAGPRHVPAAVVLVLGMGLMARTLRRSEA